MGEYSAVVLGIKRKRPKDTQLETLIYVTKGRLRPLIVCLSHSWGGLEQIAVNDALDLAKEGIKIFYLCLLDSPTYHNLKGKENIEVIALSFTPRNYFDFKLKKFLLDILQSYSINLLHCHQTSLLGSIIPWVWRMRHLVIICSRHITNSHIKKNFYHQALYSRLDAFVVMSESLKINTLETHALKEKQLWVIPYGIDFNLFDPEKIQSDAQREMWGADKETIVIGLVGRIDPAKGQATFIKAAAGLMKNKEYAHKKFKFIIVGEETRGAEDGYLDELKKMVIRFGLEEKVVFAGFSTNVPEDAFDLQNKLRYLLDHPDERKKMAHRAKSYVRSRYDCRERVRKTVELYEWSLRRRGQ